MHVIQHDFKISFTSASPLNAVSLHDVRAVNVLQILTAGASDSEAVIVKHTEALFQSLIKMQSTCHVRVIVNAVLCDDLICSKSVYKCLFSQPELQSYTSRNL